MREYTFIKRCFVLVNYIHAFSLENSPCCCCLVARSCPALWDPTDCSLPGSSVHGIFQARILQWIAVPYSRGIFLTPGSNPCLLHSRQTLYHLNHQRNSYQLHSQLASSDLLCWALGSMKKLIHIFEAQKEQLARHHKQESKLAV